MNWQPIETAPELTDVLVYSPKWGVPICAIKRRNGAGTWHGFGQGLIADPTHWRPLPAPPDLLGAATRPTPSEGDNEDLVKAVRQLAKDVDWGACGRCPVSGWRRSNQHSLRDNGRHASRSPHRQSTASPVPC